MNRRVACLLLALWGGFLVIALYHPRVGWARKPTRLVNWTTPAGLVVELGPGEMRDVDTSFTALRKIGHGRISLSSNLEASIAASPAEFRHVKKGAVSFLHLTVHVSETAGAGDVPGTLSITRIGRDG